jgi:uncharacterized membrane protein YozB (DUF420 family)
MHAPEDGNLPSSSTNHTAAAQLVIVVIVVSLFCLVGRNGISLHQKRMDTGDLPTSVAIVLYLSIQYFTSRSMQEFHNQFSHSVASQQQFLLLFHLFFYWQEYNQHAQEEDACMLPATYKAAVQILTKHSG